MAVSGSRYHVFGGGTFSPVRNHMALSAPTYGDLSAPAFGQAAREITQLFADRHLPTTLHLTRMASEHGTMVTNADVAKRLDEVLKNLATKAIIMSAALCDFDGQIDDVPSGSHAPRLQSRAAPPVMTLLPAEKILGRIHDQRPDICSVGFKTTTNCNPEQQFQAATRQIAESKVSFVLANDTITRINILFAARPAAKPEVVYISGNRATILGVLVDAVVRRVGTPHP